MEQLADVRTPTPAPPPNSAVVVPFPVLTETERPTLTALFAAEESGLLRYAISIVRRRSVAEELVQEAFLRLHQTWSQVEQPRAWLYRSVRNLALNHVRDQPRNREVDLRDDAPTPDAKLPAEQLERDEAVGTMRLLIAEMAPEDGELLRLKYNEGLRYDEISRRTGLSVGNVGYRLHHLLKALADRLRRAGIDGSEA
jgi:RNA polymerase sigma factor (sigma-70 family)